MFLKKLFSSASAPPAGKPDEKSKRTAGTGRAAQSRGGEQAQAVEPGGVQDMANALRNSIRLDREHRSNIARERSKK